MIDPLLEARLDALDLQLDKAIHNNWLLELPGSQELPADVWTSLKGSIGLRALHLKGTVAELRQRLNALGSAQADSVQLRSVWADYGDVYHESQELFSEFLEFIGGLAFRDRPERGSIFRIADEIVRKCSDETMPILSWRSITVPSQQEAVKTTLAKIIRLRFPEQTIWTVPFVAHEFGHVVMGSDAFEPFVSDMAKTWAKGKLRLGMGKAMDQRSALLQVAELGADAFATFYVGPAYACAAVHLKLDLVTSSPRSASSFDLARGHVILKMLKDMDEADGGQSPFRNVVSRLEATWDDARKAAGRRPLDLGESERLNQFVVSIRRKFRYSLLPSSVYPYSEPGWYTANKWFKHWEVSLGTGNPSAPIEGVSKLSALRDALNAAWLFWLFHKHPDGGGARAPEPCLQVKQLEDQVLRLCSLIIEKQYTQRETQSVPNPGGS